MRLVFAGTPEFAQRALAELHAAGHQIALVLTQPDRPVGRGLHLAPSAVKRFATESSFPIYQPTTLRSEEAVAKILGVAADALVVAAYGLILPTPLLGCARLGAWNIHASILPRWRGAAPIQRALLAGDLETGVSIMQMDEGLDTGPVLSQQRVRIEPADDFGSLHDKLAVLGAKMMAEALVEVQAGRGHATPQSSIGITYAPKITKGETLLAWSRPADELERAVRAFCPTPGALATVQGTPLKIWRARVVKGKGPPGTLLETKGDSLVVACGLDALEILEVQRPGGRRISSADFLRGRPLDSRTRLGR